MNKMESDFSIVKDIMLIRISDQFGDNRAGYMLTAFAFENGVTVIQWVSVLLRQNVKIYAGFELFHHFYVGRNEEPKTEIMFLYDGIDRW